MVICREWTLVKRIGDRITAEPLKCKCWHCEYCAPVRQKQLRKIGYAGQPNRFLTLTVNPKLYGDKHERARKLVWAWRNLRRRMIRELGFKTVPFLAVFEAQKSGEPHLHILLRCGYVDQAWISDAMRDMIGAPIVDIRAVTDQKRIGWYVAKYVGKDPKAFEGTKRYWRSKDWMDPARGQGTPPHPDDGAIFTMRREGLYEYAQSIAQWGGTVEWQGKLRFEAHHPLTGPPVLLRKAIE